MEKNSNKKLNRKTAGFQNSRQGFKTLQTKNNHVSTSIYELDSIKTDFKSPQH